MAFDVLYLNGKDISKKPLAERTEILREIISSSDQKQIAFWRP
jgi:ATP-dependent DNA ligase